MPTDEQPCACQVCRDGHILFRDSVLGILGMWDGKGVQEWLGTLQERGISFIVVLVQGH